MINATYVFLTFMMNLMVVWPFSQQLIYTRIKSFRALITWKMRN